MVVFMTLKHICSQDLEDFKLATKSVFPRYVREELLSGVITPAYYENNVSITLCS